jgi:Sec-independent protein translocase protein TatA
LINLGPGDFVLIGLALLLVFGAGRLPALGDFIGRTLRGSSKGEPPKG